MHPPFSCRCLPTPTHLIGSADATFKPVEPNVPLHGTVGVCNSHTSSASQGIHGLGSDCRYLVRVCFDVVRLQEAVRVCCVHLSQAACRLLIALVNNDVTLQHKQQQQCSAAIDVANEARSKQCSSFRTENKGTTSMPAWQDLTGPTCVSTHPRLRCACHGLAGWTCTQECASRTQTQQHSILACCSASLTLAH